MSKFNIEMRLIALITLALCVSCNKPQSGATDNSEPVMSEAEQEEFAKLVAVQKEACNLEARVMRNIASNRDEGVASGEMLQRLHLEHAYEDGHPSPNAQAQRIISYVTMAYGSKATPDQLALVAYEDCMAENAKENKRDLDRQKAEQKLGIYR